MGWGGVLKWVCGMGCETEVAREWNVGTLTMNKLSGVAETLVARMWQGFGKRMARKSEFPILYKSD